MNCRVSIPITAERAAQLLSGAREAQFCLSRWLAFDVWDRRNRTERDCYWRRGSPVPRAAGQYGTMLDNDLAYSHHSGGYHGS
jgi:hypothetical protein